LTAKSYKSIVLLKPN